MANKTVESGTSLLLIRFYDKNDEDALTEFFQKYKDLVFRIAYSILGNQADADDIMQHAFVQVIKKQSICKAAYESDDSKVKSWLLSIVYNLSRMHLRTQKLKKTVSLEEERTTMSFAEDHHTNDDNASDKSEVSLKLKSAIFTLPEKYRVPILMRYHEDMSIDDISKTLSVNSSTIRSLLSRGINLLKNKLSGENVMLSSTAAIEMISLVPFPISQKSISLSYLNSLAVAKTTSAKIAIASQAKSYILLKSLVAVVLITVASTYILISNNNKTTASPTLQTPPTKTIPLVENKTPSRTSWDFSKEDGSAFKTLYNSITYDSKLKAITNFRGAPDKKVTNEQSIINLEFKIVNFTRIHAKGKMLSKDFIDKQSGNSLINNFALDFVALKNNKPLPGFIIYKTPKPIDLTNSKEMPFEQDLYIVDNLITHIAKGHGFVNIMRFDNLDSETEIGLLLSGMYVESISIEKMSPELVEDIKKQTAAVLTAQKQKK